MIPLDPSSPSSRPNVMHPRHSSETISPVPPNRLYSTQTLLRKQDASTPAAPKSSRSAHRGCIPRSLLVLTYLNMLEGGFCSLRG